MKRMLAALIVLWCAAASVFGAAAEPLYQEVEMKLLGLAVQGRPEPVLSHPDISKFFLPDFGMRVDHVMESFPAAEAGLQPGDIILAVNDAPCEDVSGLASALIESDLAESLINIRVLRKGERVPVQNVSIDLRGATSNSWGVPLIFSERSNPYFREFNLLWYLLNIRESRNYLFWRFFIFCERETYGSGDRSSYTVKMFLIPVYRNTIEEGEGPRSVVYF